MVDSHPHVDGRFLLVGEDVGDRHSVVRVHLDHAGNAALSVHSRPLTLANLHQLAFDVSGGHGMKPDLVSSQTVPCFSVGVGAPWRVGILCLLYFFSLCQESGAIYKVVPL